MDPIRTEGNWGQRNGREPLVTKTDTGEWGMYCPWEDCVTPVLAPTRGDALEQIADHILEVHA
jgi:hypothetical protein